MELTFIVNAIRRYLWVVVGVTVLGLVAGLLLGSDDSLRYESRSTLLVSPPVDARGGSTVDRDRYVAGQISVLGSEAMADRVIARLDDGTPRSEVASAVSIENEPNTDVVYIVVSTPNPERSQQIGEAYLAEYFDTLREQVDNTQEPEIQKQNDRIEDLRAQLEINDAAIADAMSPYLGRESPPEADMVVPHLVTEREILDFQMQAAMDTLNVMETDARLRVSSEVVQQATLPSAPLASGPNLLAGVGLIGGFGLGIFGAIVLARISPLVMGDDQAEEILGYPVVGQVPVYPRARDDRASLLNELPRSIAGFIGGLAVRAEATPRERQSLAVVVISPRRGAGSTTLASMVARRFADGGAKVLLVDADRHDPELRSLFMAGQAELPVALVRQSEPVVGDEAAEILAFRPTELENLYVTDLHTVSGAERLRPAQVAEVVSAATDVADVVIFDGGPLLATATTMHLTRACNIVLLGVPVQQDARELESLAAEVRGRAVIPVWTPTRPGQGFLARLPLLGPRLAKRSS